MELESFVSRNLKKQDNIEELAMEMIKEEIKIMGREYENIEK